MMNTIKTLLLTGANNHDWRRSAPFCKQLMERSGRFSVDITENPSMSLQDAAALSAYQLFFLDYNGPDWGEPAKSNFVKAVAGGTGVVVLHAADNAFPGWVEYEKMVGLLWREGTGHGSYHEFEVTIVDHEHPVTKGLGSFRLQDELYHRLVHMHNVPYHVLATAYSDPKTGGTGRHEPVMITIQYGQGRIYHHVLGHVWAGSTMATFENKGFQEALLRGCEWAATGK